MSNVPSNMCPHPDERESESIFYHLKNSLFFIRVNDQCSSVLIRSVAPIPVYQWAHTLSYPTINTNFRECDGNRSFHYEINQIASVREKVVISKEKGKRKEEKTRTREILKMRPHTHILSMLVPQTMPLSPHHLPQVLNSLWILRPETRASGSTSNVRCCALQSAFTVHSYARR